MGYRKETYASQLKGIDEFTSRLDTPSSPSGQNWLYTKERNITKRPGSLSVSLPSADGYIGMLSFVPSTPTTGTDISAIVNTSPLYIVSTLPTYSTILNNSNNALPYVNPTLLSMSRTGQVTRIRRTVGAIKNILNYGSCELELNSSGYPTITAFNPDTVLSTTVELSSSNAYLGQVANNLGMIATNAYGFNFGNQPSFSVAEPNGLNSNTLENNYLDVYGIDVVPTSLLLSGFTDGVNNTNFELVNSTPTAASDTNIATISYNGLAYWAGQNGPLMCYDGARGSIAGTIVSNPYSYSTAAGALTGAYKYIFRPKVYRPNGTISYGRNIAVNGVVLAGQQAVFTRVTNDSYFLNNIIQNIGATKQFPRRTSLFKALSYSSNSSYPTSLVLSFTNFNSQPSTALQPGELLYFPPVAGQEQLWQVISVTNRINTSLNKDEYIVNIIPSSFVASASVTAGTLFSLGESIEVFRTVDSGDTYYKVTEIPSGVSFNDNLSDANLVSNEYYSSLGYDAGPPPEYTSSVAVHQQRLIVTCGTAITFPFSSIFTDQVTLDTVVWSEPETDAFPSDNSVVLALDPDDLGLTASYSQDGILYIASERAIWIIQGDLSSAETFTVEKLATHNGVISNTAIGSIEGHILALSDVGILDISGRSVSLELGLPVKPLIISLPKESLKRACVTVKDNLWILSIPGMGKFDTTTNKYTENVNSSLWLVYDITYKCWYKWTNLPSGGVTVYDNFIWCSSRDNLHGITRITDIMASDAHNYPDQPSNILVPIDMQFKTNWQGNESAGQNKHFARAQILSTTSDSQNFGLRVRTESNWVENVYEQDTTLSFNNGTGYAEAPYATVPYGDANVVERMIPLSNPKAKSLRLTMSNNDVAEKPIISGWTIEMSDNTENVKDI